VPHKFFLTCLVIMTMPANHVPALFLTYYVTCCSYLLENIRNTCKSCTFLITLIIMTKVATPLLVASLIYVSFLGKILYDSSVFVYVHNVISVLLLLFLTMAWWIHLSSLSIFVSIFGLQSKLQVYVLSEFLCCVCHIFSFFYNCMSLI
jgi:hypothetical protein